MNKLFIAVFCLFGFMACEKDEFVAPNDLADVKAIVGSRSLNDDGAYIVELGDQLAFADISQGALSHEWIIESGNAFISNDFSPEDSVFTDFIIPGQALSSEDPTAYVLFQTPGLQRVRLRNVFDRQVSFTSTGTTAVQEGSNWVIDTAYLVDVFADIRPAFKVYQDGEEVLSVSAEDEPDMANSASWPTVTLEVGQTLDFVDLTTEGRPTARRWTLEGGAPTNSTDSVATITYPGLGEQVGGVFRVSRSGGGVPASTVEKVIPLRVMAVPSSEPFVFTGELGEQEDDVLSFRISGEALAFSGEEANFTVQVTNGEANFDQAIAVQQARVNPNDATFIDLVLAEPIYGTDTVMVMYSGGAINSADGRTLSAFGPEEVAFESEDNVLTDVAYTFEADPSVYFLQQPQWSISNEQAASGSFSAKFAIDDPASGAGNMRIQTTSANVSMIFPAGNYAVSAKFYIPSGTDIVKMNTNLGEPFQAITWDLTGVTERDQWITLTQNMELQANDNTMMNSRFVIGVRRADISSASAVLYLDDLSFVPREVRP